MKQLFCVIHLQTVETAFLAATYHTNMYVFVLGWRNRNTSVESRLILQARMDDTVWNIFPRSYRIGSVFLMSLEAKVEITRKIIPTLYGSVDDSMHPWLWTSATWQLLHHSKHEDWEVLDRIQEDSHCHPLFADFLDVTNPWNKNKQTKNCTFL